MPVLHRMFFFVFTNYFETRITNYRSDFLPETILKVDVVVNK